MRRSRCTADSAVGLRFDNRSHDAALVAIARLADGVTPDDLEHIVATAPDQAETMAEPVVVAGAEAGQQGSEIGIPTRPGTYVLACLTYRRRRGSIRPRRQRGGRAVTARDRPKSGGDEGTRTPDPRDANAVLSQLSYIPTGVGV